MGKIRKSKKSGSRDEDEGFVTIKSNSTRKVGSKRGFSVSLSSHPPKRVKTKKDTTDEERSLSTEPLDLLAQRFIALENDRDNVSFSNSGIASEENDESVSDGDEESSDEFYKTCDDLNESSEFSQSSTPQRSSSVPTAQPKQAGMKIFIHHGIMYLVLSDFACTAFGGSGYLVILQGSIALYGVKVSASENLVLPVESAPGSCIMLVNRGSRSQIGNLRESFDRIGGGRSLNKATELLSRYPRKTIVAIQGRLDNFTTLRPDFSSADDSTPENTWESSGFYVLPVPSVGVPNNRRFDEIVQGISESALREPVRVVLGGSKNSGKSSLIRALCNRLLLGRIRNQNQDGEQNTCPILVLDLDPGQTEFTPPGCVSLVEVTETLMGPPSSHQVRPEKSFLIGGGSTPGAHPDMYVRSIELLMQHLHENNCSSYILLVNTMGWVSGIGELLFGNILDIVEPTRLLCLEPDFKIPSTAWPCKTVTNSPPVTHISALRSMFSKDPYTKAVSAALHREASIIGYFNGSAIMEKHPYVIPWSKVALHEITCVAPSQEILYLINGNMVALCRVPERLLLKSKSKPLLPKLFHPNRKGQDEPFECLGFGIVRCVDPVNKWIYIATPESPDVFDSVNALIYNSISLPSLFYVNQRSEVAPYVEDEGAKLNFENAMPLTVGT